jgi:hypothetical protein
MLEITFKEFYEYQYPKEELYELYVMKNGLEEVLYIGISSQNIWNRWFAWNGHIRGDARYMIGDSDVGKKIVAHLPDSWSWRIQLWTLEDCIVYCMDEINPNGRYTIKFLEPIMIQKFCPSLNETYNLKPGIDRMPKSEKEKKREAELDKAYYEAFEKKLK